MTTFEDLHAGDHVLGHDNDTWGVAAITRSPRLVVALVKPGSRLVGYPPPGTPVTVLHRADIRVEEMAAGVLIAGGLGEIEIISEEWTGTS